MTQIDIAAPLAAALAARGYTTLTQVQDAVLAAEVTGRDLLVSAQTGSGKTAAFGIAIAGELLCGADRLLFADLPMALIIAPTRELALQVARELEWLYAETGAQIATCVGGMDYRTEKRALDRGAHIVVGTPGRLRDHIERHSLDLSGLRAVVLDEADEMLDLGFREDLEFILGAAPAERRTLMFSATVPAGIAELAKDFQRDALRLHTAGEARQHVDIEYRALNVSSRDREHAIFNLLRYYDAPSALVFCKTRAAVSHLLARMGNRGFQVVALSGELSQQERTHALQSLRDGRAQVCIATDIAARGIDLPGLDLVIHADLPGNSETLLHRSGRTGRAGAKGVSALIVTPAEFRKAQRLLQGAKVVAEWAKAPSAEEVQAKDDARVLEHPALTATPGDEAAIAATLLARFGADHVAAAFVRLWREGRSAPEVLQDAVAGSAPAPARERGEFGSSVWFALSVGRAGRAEARWLLPKICDGGGITRNEIGAIRVQEAETFVQIATAAAGKFGTSLELEAGVVMRRLPGEPNLARPERAPRKSHDRPAPHPVRAEKPAYVPKPPRIVEEVEPPPPPVAPPPVAAPPVAAPPVAAPPSSAAAAAKKPYVRRDQPEAPRKPYTRRDEAGPKPWTPRDGGPKAPYVPRVEGAKKPYVRRDDAAAKPNAPRGDAPRKPYAPRPESDPDRKPRWKPEGKAAGKPFGSKAAGSGAPRSAGFKSHGGKTEGPDARPARAAGFKSHASDGKTFGKPAFAKARPAAPKVDAKDTSKRFTPPRKPQV